MPFFRDLRELRRRSKAILITENSPAKPVNDAAIPTTKSTSTLDSLNDNSTPLSSFPPQSSTSKPLNPSEPPPLASRPSDTSPVKRLSISVRLYFVLACLPSLVLCLLTPVGPLSGVEYLVDKRCRQIQWPATAANITVCSSSPIDHGEFMGTSEMELYRPGRETTLRF